MMDIAIDIDEQIPSHITMVTDQDLSIRETDHDRGNDTSRSMSAGISPPVTSPHTLTEQNPPPRVTFPPLPPSMPMIVGPVAMGSNVELQMMRVPNTEETRAISQLRAWIGNLNPRELLIVMDAQQLNTTGHDAELRDRMLRHEIRSKVSQDLARWSEGEDQRDTMLPLTWPVMITEPAIEEFVDAAPRNAQRSLPPTTIVPSFAGNPYSRTATPLLSHQVPPTNNTHANIGGRDVQYTNANHSHIQQHQHATQTNQTHARDYVTQLTYIRQNEQVAQQYETQTRTNHMQVNELSMTNDYRRLAEQIPYDGQLHRETYTGHYTEENSNTHRLHVLNSHSNTHTQHQAHVTHNTSTQHNLTTSNMQPDNTHTVTHIDSSYPVDARAARRNVSTAYIAIAPRETANMHTPIEQGRRAGLPTGQSTGRYRDPVSFSQDSTSASRQNSEISNSLEEAGPRKGTVTFAEVHNIIETPRSSTPTQCVEDSYRQHEATQTLLRTHMNTHTANSQYPSPHPSQISTPYQSFPSQPVQHTFSAPQASPVYPPPPAPPLYQVNPSHTSYPVASLYQTTPSHPPQPAPSSYQSFPWYPSHVAPPACQSTPAPQTNIHAYQHHPPSQVHHTATQYPPPQIPLPPPNAPYAQRNVTHTVSSPEYVPAAESNSYAHGPSYYADAPGSAMQYRSEYAPTRLADLTMGFLPYGEDNASRSGTHSYKVGKCGTYLRTLKVSFDGTNGEADEVLRRVKEAAEIHGLTDEETMNVLPYVLDGQALNWFRADKGSCRRYADFVQRFRLRFSSLDSDSRIREEIRTRTQGLNEPLATYLTSLQILFSRLKNPGPIEAQLDVVYGNLNPRYMAAMDRSAINSYEEFLVVGHRFEEKLRRMASYMPPKVLGKNTAPPASHPNNHRRNDRVAAVTNNPGYTVEARSTPHTTPHPPRPKKTSQTIGTQTTPPPSVESSPSRTQAKRTCYNCNEEGHFIRECPLPLNRRPSGNEYGSR